MVKYTINTYKFWKASRSYMRFKKMVKMVPLVVFIYKLDKKYHKRVMKWEYYLQGQGHLRPCLAPDVLEENK